ncbi:MAG: oxidoreductase [Candidatus Parcubacteria bacterium]|jgi:2-polyprenyl-6-methoxyphenol hydroxylase-like FAD-dependent oxidoreductase
MKILIIGAGIGGLALAGFCEQFGIEYDIVEKQPDQSHHGFSLGMWINGRRMLTKLGLRDMFDAHAKPFRYFNIFNGKKELVQQYNFDPFFQEYGMGYFHIHRKALIDGLQSKLPAGKVEFSKTVTDIENVVRPNVTFANGEKKSYDLVVGADGACSATREKYFKHAVRTFVDWRVWYIWIDPKYADPHAVSTHVEPGQYIIIFNEGDKALAVLVARQDHTVWDKEENRMATLNKVFAKENTLVPNILLDKQAADILPSDLSEIHTSCMYDNRIALLGDAAHGFEPFAGLGGSMAMEDAYVLASELYKAKDLDVALRVYNDKRMARVAKALKITHRMQKISATTSSFGRKIMNFFLKYMSHKVFVKDYFKFLNEEI